jgi:hypothetical protein
MQDPNLSKGAGEDNKLTPPDHIIDSLVSLEEADRYRKRFASEEIKKQDAEEGRFGVLQFAKNRAISLGWSLACAVSVTVVFEPVPPVMKAGLTTFFNWSGVTVVQTLKKVHRPKRDSDK